MASGELPPDPTIPPVADTGTNLPGLPPVIPSNDEFLEAIKQQLAMWEKEVTAKTQEIMNQVGKWHDDYSKDIFQTLTTGVPLSIQAHSHPLSRFKKYRELPKTPVPPGTGIPLDTYLASLPK